MTGQVTGGATPQPVPLAGLPDGKLGLAVSGGGDSVAMLRLVAAARGDGLFVYTVDHGLRAEAAAEAQFVANLCAVLDVPCRVLRWDGNASGNLSAAARAARYDLIARAAKADGVGTVLLAHTRDDQAETVLMGLARRAGVDGLSAMPAQMQDRGITWMRPLLNASRAGLRGYLTEIGQAWVDDPSNEDTQYERVRMRQAAQDLAKLGLTVEALSDVATNMQSARAALEAATDAAWHSLSQTIAGAVQFDRAGFEALPQDIQRRLVLRACQIAAPAGPAPRKDPILAFLKAPDPKTTSFGGCLVLVKPTALWVCREPNAVSAQTTPAGAVWDGKWRVSAENPDQSGVIRALGEDGLYCFPDWRDAGIPRQVLMTTPAVWHETRLIAAPLVVHHPNWSAALI